jgi:hypothetical protein
MERFYQLIYGCFFLGCLGSFVPTQAQLRFWGNAERESGNPRYCVQITSNAANAKGWVYSEDKINLNNTFSIEFQVYIGANDAGADGLIFLLHNDPRELNATGCNGNSIGYATDASEIVCNGTQIIQPSFGVEVDTHWNNIKNDPDDTNKPDHTAFVFNGSNLHPSDDPTNVAWTNPSNGYIFPANIETNTLHYFRFDWNPTSNTISFYWDNTTTPILQRVEDIRTLFAPTTDVYWGFTGATGNSINQQYFCSNQEIILNGNALPITLLNFDAQQVNNQVDLQWTTLTEINNHFFTIEKSKNGVNYELVGVVDGAGNSNQLKKYTLTDDKPFLGANYYRLKQTDVDGKSEVFTAVYLHFIPNGKDFLEVYPNPVMSNQPIHITLNNFDKDEFNLTIQDIYGRKVYEYHFENEEPKNFYLPLSLTSGMYLVVLSSSYKVFQQKLIVQ